jgi:hypothetical protein
MRLLFLYMFVMLHGGQIESGYAPHYAKNVMERVARNRDMPHADCMVSSPRYPLGTMIWVYGRNTDTLLHCRVTDVSHPRDKARHLRTRRVVELGYTEAERLCGLRAMRDRPEKCPVIVVNLE